MKKVFVNSFIAGIVGVTMLSSCGSNQKEDAHGCGHGCGAGGCKGEAKESHGCESTSSVETVSEEKQELYLEKTSTGGSHECGGSACNSEK